LNQRSVDDGDELHFSGAKVVMEEAVHALRRAGCGLVSENSRGN
jgi:hypothetical protein